MKHIFKKAGRGTVMLVGYFKNYLKPADCKVHQFLNITGLEILKRDGYEHAVKYYTKDLEMLQRGTIWADRGFSGLSHFYSPYGDKRSMGIFENSMELAVKFEAKANLLAAQGRHSAARFYLGALLHLIQDATIPHHAALKLLKGHHAFEVSVRRRYKKNGKGLARSGAICFDELREYIQFAAKIALKALKIYGSGANEQDYRLIAKCVMPIAERLTAGYLLHFYETQVLGIKKESRVTGKISTLDSKLIVNKKCEMPFGARESKQAEPSPD